MMWIKGKFEVFHPSHISGYIMQEKKEHGTE